MANLEPLISGLKDFKNQIQTIIQEAIRSEEAWVLDMNTESQLFEKGINRLGVEIASYEPYAPMTIEIKKMKGQPTSRVTLRDEGDFHNSFYIEYQSDGFQIKAKDWKTDALENRYGHQIFGLTDENFKTISMEVVKPLIFEKLKKLR